MPYPTPDIETLTGLSFITDELGQLNQLLRQQNKYISPTAPINAECRENCSEEQEADDHSNHRDTPLSFHQAAGQQKNKPFDPMTGCPQCQELASDKSVLFYNLNEPSPESTKVEYHNLLHVPTRRQSEILFRCWYSGVHPLIPIAYPPMTFEVHEKFWKWCETCDKTNEPPPSADSIALLFSVWYAGSVSISIGALKTDFNGINRAVLSSTFHDQTLKWLIGVDFPRNSSLLALSSFLMLTSLPAKEEEPLSVSMNVAMAVRAAQAMGLHRDPQIFNLPPWEVRHSYVPFSTD